MTFSPISQHTMTKMRRKIMFRPKLNYKTKGIVEEEKGW